MPHLGKKRFHAIQDKEKHLRNKIMFLSDTTIPTLWSDPKLVGDLHMNVLNLRSSLWSCC